MVMFIAGFAGGVAVTLTMLILRACLIIGKRSDEESEYDGKRKE